MIQRISAQPAVKVTPVIVPRSGFVTGGYSILDVEKQQKLQGLRQILSLAKQAAAKNDFTNKTKTIPNTKSQSSLARMRPNEEDMVFVCHDKQFFGKLNGVMYTVEDIIDFVEILTNWSKYEAQARKVGLR